MCVTVMDIKERKNTRRIIVDIIYDKRLSPSDKSDQIVTYIDSIVKRDKLIDHFDAIDMKRDENVSRCCATFRSFGYDCTSPCRYFYAIIILTFKLMFVIMALISAIYIVYFFVARLS